MCVCECECVCMSVSVCVCMSVHICQQSFPAECDLMNATVAFSDVFTSMMSFSFSSVSKRLI